ncbi:MAG: hypothetical protein HC916_17925 [Coleofasciculaceae cyanobacterium SM2_1_6]|nr:hypothetical protein [Coleofasciculaceae cyanobacterium SM2_1_6]
MAQTPPFYERTRESLVLIQGTRRGTGFIVARDNNTYYALTAGHVVRDGRFQVRTEAGRETVSVQEVLPIPGVDLALIQFTSNRDYRPLELSTRNAETVVVTNQVFVLGYSEGSDTPQIPGGGVTSRDRPTSGSGTGIFYSVNTAGGMSGSPVLTDRGQVVGIHIGLPTANNFGEAIPIEKYFELAPQVFTQAARRNLAERQFEQAIASLETVRRVFKEDQPETMMILAYSYFGLGDTSRARQEAGRISSTNANASLLLAAIDYIEGNYPRAIENATRAADFDRANLGGYAFSILGLSQIATQSNDSARNSIQNASGILREDAFVYLANSCFKHKVLLDNDRARSDFINADRLSGQRVTNPFLAVISPKLQETARACLPPNIGNGSDGNILPNRPYKLNEPINLSISVVTLAVSNDSRLVAVGLLDGSVSVYDVRTRGKVASFSGQSSSIISSLAFSPNGQDIAVALSNGQLKVFNVQSGVEKYGYANVGDFPKVSLATMADYFL